MRTVAPSADFDGKAYVATLPRRPGVYRMLDARGDVLYVGKARALKNRVTQYTQVARQPRRLLRMISQTRSMQIVTTNTEAEALQRVVAGGQHVAPRQVNGQGHACRVVGVQARGVHFVVDPGWQVQVDLGEQHQGQDPVRERARRRNAFGFEQS